MTTTDKMLILTLLIFPAIILSTLMMLSSSSLAEPVAERDGSESRETYWGHLPPPVDSTMAVYRKPPRSVGEELVRLPWRVVGLPFKVSSGLLRHGIIYADEHGSFKQLRRLIGPMTGPFGIKFRLVAGGVGGLGFGLDTRHHALFDPGNEMRLLSKFSLNGSTAVALGLHLNSRESRSYLFSAGYNLLTAAHYYGRGATTVAEDESTYTRELAWCGVGVNQTILPRLTCGVSAYYSSAATRGPRNPGGDDPALADVFAITPTGYGERTGGLISRLVLVHDTTYDDGRPASGGMRSLGLSHFHETVGQGDDFITILADVEQYYPVVKSGQTLALRGFYQWIVAADVDSIPFQRLLTNETPYALRGYRDFRWRDRGLAVLSAEYRWPLWASTHADKLGLDLYLFSEHGQVFAHWDEINSGNLTHSYGGGLRLIGNGGFAGRLEIGRSGEGAVWRLQLNQTFQSAKGGVLNGFSQAVLR
ncbi:MAG: BamA/TamA family outer membrane protein [bacterium]|nr:BamA/TamA family outer membrane protein [bacterium]